MHPLILRTQQLAAERDAATLMLQQAQARHGEASDLVGQLAQVEQFFNVLADEKRALLETRVQRLVDHGIKFVFGPQYSFQVRSELAGKQIKTRFYVTESDLELNIVDAAGGGIADVVSFLLRIVMLLLRRPVQRRVLILDEGFKWVSAGHMPQLTQLITELSTTLGLSLIMVTHRPELVDCATTLVTVTKPHEASVAVVQVVG